MFKSTLIIILVLLPFNLSADEIITGHYCYTYGDNETLVEAREITRTLAIRNAIESYRIFIESTTKVDNYSLSNDLIQTISSGYLKNIKVLSHSESKRTICETIQCTVEPEEVKKIITQKLHKITEEIENTGIDNNGYIKILNTKKNIKNNCIDISIKILVNITNEFGAAFGLNNFYTISKNGKGFGTLNIQSPKFKVYITYFDESGNPIDGDSKIIFDDKSDPTSIQGEIRCISFCNIPNYLKSYKVHCFSDNKKNETNIKKESQRRLRRIRSKKNNNKYLQILKTQHDIRKGCIKVTLKILQTISQPSPQKMQLFKVFITYFDSSGVPIDGESSYIQKVSSGNNKDEDEVLRLLGIGTKKSNTDILIPGEIKSISFCNIPNNATFFKVWLHDSKIN